MGYSGKDEWDGFSGVPRPYLQPQQETGEGRRGWRDGLECLRRRQNIFIRPVQQYFNVGWILWGQLRWICVFSRWTRVEWTCLWCNTAPEYLDDNCPALFAALLMKYASCAVLTRVIGILWSHCVILMWLSNRGFAAFCASRLCQLGFAGWESLHLNRWHLYGG